MAYSLFVYWHVAPGDQAAAEAAARDLQAHWRLREAALSARLYRRPDASRQRVTLMETYSAPAGLSEELLARIAEDADRQLAHLAIDGRHRERFEAAD